MTLQYASVAKPTRILPTAVNSAYVMPSLQLLLSSYSDMYRRGRAFSVAGKATDLWRAIIGKLQTIPAALIIAGILAQIAIASPAFASYSKCSLSDAALPALHGRAREICAHVQPTASSP